VYELSPDRLQRYHKLFIDPEFEVEQLPPYETSISSNPFKVFTAIPPDSRCRFLLDDARFFIEGFIKGPVCRGQIAVNTPPSKAGGFQLRLKAGSIGHSAD